MKRAIPIIIVMLALIGCAGQQVSNIDQAIQARAAFNIALGSFNANLVGMPEPLKTEYAAKAVPVVQSGVLALNTMDALVAAGSAPTPETLQQYLAAKNALIDMVAEMVIKKGGK